MLGGLQDRAGRMLMSRHPPWLTLLCLPLLANAAAPPRAAPAVPAGPPSFTVEQVAAGRQLYARQCAPCHGAAQEGGEAGPALRGNAFQTKWAGKPWQELFEQMRRTMPVTQPAGLPRSQYEDLTALLLSVNGQEAGTGAAVGRQCCRIARAGAARCRYRMAASPRRCGQHELLAAEPDTARQHFKDAVAWRWKSDNFGASIYPNNEVTPLMARGVLYATTGAARSVVGHRCEDRRDTVDVSPR